MTARSLVWDGLVIGGTFLLLYGGTTLVAFALIGTTTKPERRPVLAVMSWWRAHRLPLPGLLFPERGRHSAGDGWHPLDDDEEAGDGAAAERLADHHDERAAGRLTHAGEDDEEETDARMPRSGMRRADPVRDAGLPPPLVPGAEGGQERGLRGVEGRRGSGHAGAPERDEPRDRGDDAAADADDDLSGLSAEDTDTLRAIRAIKAEHLVLPHEPERWDGGYPEHDARCEDDECEGACLDRPPTTDHPGPAPGMDVDTSSGPGPGADRQPDAGRFTSLMRALRRDGPARFWTAATMSECAQTAALLALADSILAGAT